MHEYVYADRVLQSVLDDAARVQRGPVRFEIEVGELLGLAKESLTVPYGILAWGTRAEGSTLRVKLAEGYVERGSYGFRGRIPIRGHQHGIDPAFASPECGKPFKVVAGLGIELNGILWESDLKNGA